MNPDNALFDAMVASSSDLSLVLDENGIIRYAAPASARSIGYEPEDLKARSFFTLMHPSDVHRASEVLQAALASDAPTATFECRVRCRDGSWRIFDVRADVLLSSLHARHVLIGCRDVTARSNAARQLRLAQSLLASQSDANQEGTLVLSTDGDVLQCNQQFLQMWGIDPALTLLRSEADVWPRVIKHLEDPNAFLKTLAVVAMDPQGTHALRLQTRSGGVIECVTSPVDGLSDERSDRVWRLKDTTHEQRAHEQLQQAQQLASVGQFSARVAHDFHACLAPVTGHAELVSSHLPPEDPLQEHLRAIIGATQLGRNLAHQIFAFAYGSSLGRQPLNLGTTVLETQPLLRSAVGPTADLRVAIDSQTPIIYADAIGMQRILLNLVLHAAQAVRRPGGVIEIGVVGMNSHGAIRARLSRPHAELRRFVRLTVADNGVGMDAETIERLFDPVLAQTAMPRSGLGLAIVEEIVTRHGGYVSVESHPDTGTTFRVDLPVMPADARCCGTEVCEGALTEDSPGAT